MPGLRARSNLRVPDEGSVLNIRRPQNPFTPTDQLDWKASETKTRQSHALEHGDFKDLDIHDLAPISDGSQSLPLDSNLDSQREEIAQRGSNARSSSQSVAMSMSSNVARKAAPPIPKKPALFSNRQPSQESGVNGQPNSTPSRLPSGRQTSIDDRAETRFPPTLHWQQATRSDGPTLPPRSTVAVVSVPNGLMDADNEGANAIPSLQPTRRQQ